MPATHSDFNTLLSSTHPTWHAILQRGLAAVHHADPAYLDVLSQDTYLPTRGRLFAAFAQPVDAVKWVLVGEGPYPREASATGVCFMDGAVGDLWSDKGLSKPVNRATSLRNLIKMLLVADGRLTPDATTGDALAHVAAQARAAGSPWIQTLCDLQNNLMRQGFLLLNASLVFREHVAPAKEAQAWRPFLETVLAGLAEYARVQQVPPASLVLWGKIAEQLQTLPADAQLPYVAAEHPYNLSFIRNTTMQSLFAPMRLLMRQPV